MNVTTDNKALKELYEFGKSSNMIGYQNQSKMDMLKQLTKLRI